MTSQESQSVKFIHTSDWQLGATRYFLSEEAQARWTASRFEAIRRLGQAAVDEQCEFIVVAGDVFESNHVDRRTILRTCEALSSVVVPVFLLPGNHDPLDPGSVFNSSRWKSQKPENVHILDDPKQPYELRPGVEIFGAPWFTKTPLSDLVADGIKSVAEKPEGVRVMVGHGAVDSLSPDRDNPALINVGDAEAALLDGRIHYLALGDRHSKTKIGAGEQIWYSGTPEVYAFNEVDPGHALIVEINDKITTVRSVKVGVWQFLNKDADIENTADIDALEAFLASVENKEQTVVRLSLTGTVTLSDHARLMETIERSGDLFAGVHLSESRSDLVVIPSDADFSDIFLTGFADTALKKLRTSVDAGGEDAERARDALALLVRLARPTE